MKKYIIGLIAIIVLLASGFGIKYVIEWREYKEVMSALKIQDIDLAEIDNGTYIGEFDAALVGAKVKVEVINNEIKEIELLEHKNGRGKDADIIVDDIIKYQSLKVDDIAGVTNSCKTIKKAIENALRKGI